MGVRCLISFVAASICLYKPEGSCSSCSESVLDTIIIVQYTNVPSNGDVNLVSFVLYMIW